MTGMKTAVWRTAAALAAMLTLASAGALSAQVTEAPTLAPPPELDLPAVSTSRLANGMELYVVPMHEVPLVQFMLLIPGGGRADGDVPGLASFTAGMLDEGADTLDAFGIAAQTEFLGATLGTGADWDYSIVSMKAPKRNVEAALELMSTVALEPTFAGPEVQRQRDLRLAAILQQRDQPGAVASLAHAALLFPATHPYHRSLGGDSASTAALDSAAVREFYRRTYTPAGSRLVITGDVTADEARRLADEYFGGWRGAGNAAPPVPAAGAVDRRTTIYLVDKPGAAQSVVRLGHAGVDRSSPDYVALEVMNTVLGGSFTSRLNFNLRETRGYTYGAGSGFGWRPVAGPFTAAADVRSDVTDSSLTEMFKEIRSIRDSQVPAAELDRAKAYLALGLGADFETTTQMAGQVAELVRFGLPLDYYDGYVQRIMAVTPADVQRVARKYLHPDRMTVVVVGDVERIRPGIEALNLGPVEVTDMYGSPVAE